MKITELKMLENVEVEIIGGRQNYRRPNTYSSQSPGKGNIFSPNIEVNTVLNLTNAQNFGFVFGSFEELVFGQGNGIMNSSSLR